VGCGSFCLCLHVLYSELGLSTLNQSPHVFAMCYLVHALKLKSRLECASAWPAIAYVSQRYCKDIFVSEKLPSTIEESQARMQLASGTSAAHMSEQKRNQQPTGRKAAPTSLSNRNWTLHPSKLVNMLREYIHDESPLLNVLHAIDAELVKASGAWFPYIENSTVSFLDELRPAMQTAFEEIKEDYLMLDADCRVLFQNMERKMGLGTMDENESWNISTLRSYTIVAAILTELREAEKFHERTGVSVVEARVPRTNVAQKILKEYIETGAIGVPKMEGVKDV
jgi:hypothetical protein